MKISQLSFITQYIAIDLSHVHQSSLESSTVSSRVKFENCWQVEGGSLQAWWTMVEVPEQEQRETGECTQYMVGIECKLSNCLEVPGRRHLFQSSGL